MKFKELVENVNKEHGENDIPEEVFYDLGFGEYSWIVDCKVIGYRVMKWLCTDTWVGLTLYFLNDEFVFYTSQSARKSDNNIVWKDKESKQKVKAYILENIGEEEDDSEYLSEYEYNEEMGDGFHVNYGSQLLTKDVFYVDNNYKFEVKVIKIFERYEDIKLWGSIGIQFEDGLTKVVPLSDILIPYDVKENKE